MSQPQDRPRPTRSLTSRLLWLMIVFAVAAQAMILLPSLGRACQDWLAARINGAHLAALALEAAGDGMLEPELQDQLLTLAGVELVSLRTPGRSLLPLARFDRPLTVQRTIDTRRLSLPRAIILAARMIVDPRPGLIRVIGVSVRDPDTLVDLVMERTPLAEDLRLAASRIVLTGFVIAAIAAGLLFAALNWLLVHPVRGLTESIRLFRQSPEGPLPALKPQRGDEIGVAAGEFAAMREDVRAALWQRSRLAALGTAVAKINHDLRGILASALLVSDRLSESADPKVRKAAPVLLGSIERAVALCKQTMDFAREGPPALSTARFALAGLLAEAATAARAAAREGRPAEITLAVPDDVAVTADRAQLFRVFLNLLRNAIEAGARRVTVTAASAEEGITITVADDGPGLPEAIREKLFRPFLSGRQGGSGLGLAIARDVMRAHGGDIVLTQTDGSGTVFTLTLPAADAFAALSGESA